MLYYIYYILYYISIIAIAHKRRAINKNNFLLPSPARMRDIGGPVFQPWGTRRRMEEQGGGWVLQLCPQGSSLSSLHMVWQALVSYHWGN